MFQSFAQKSERSAIAGRVADLRAQMANQAIDAFIVPRADAWRGEWVQPKDERLAWISGFTGSAGVAALTADQAALFVDGRYRLQAPEETDISLFDVKHVPEDSLTDWLKSALPKQSRIAVDPWLTSLGEWARWTKALDGHAELVLLDANPIDGLRMPLPASPDQAVEIHPLEFAGKTSAEKRTEIAESLKQQQAQAALITAPDSLAWLLNLRGHLIARAPMLHGFGLICDDGRMALWLPETPRAEILTHLGEDVRLCDVEGLRQQLLEISGKVLIDKNNCPLAWVPDGGEGDRWMLGEDPCLLPKACKNEAELAGARRAHAVDAIAMVKFLAWVAGEASREPGLNEIEAVQKLEAFRRESPELCDISFETIAGAGPNGAIVHYRVNETTNRTASPAEIILIDSGGQYRFGTTDITRCLALRDIDPDTAHAYTRVLQGLIALSKLRFPKGLAGRDIDAIARAPLWQEGWDYDHGTGHGVGSYLSVHEGPQGLSRRSTTPLKAGMIVSIEPGYYRAGAFGIRLENLAAIVPAEAEAGREMLCFETLTTVPFERRLIVTELLSADEIDWIDGYHARCAATLATNLDNKNKDWLLRATAPLAQS